MSNVGARRPFRGLARMVVALVRQRRRLALATVAIALGVGYLAGALTLLDRVSGGLDALAAAGAERADLVVEGGVAYQSPLEQVRRLVPVTVGQGVAQIPGVAAVSPRIEDTATLIGADGVPLVALGLSEQPLGANWPDDARIAPYRFAAGGPPTAVGQVAIDQRSATTAKVGVGDRIAVSGRAKVAEYEIAGIVRTDQGGLPSGSSLALFTTDEARLLFDRPLDDNAVAVRLRPGADRQQVMGAIRRTLPPGIEVVDGATAAIHRQESLTRSFTLVRSLILGFAGLALVVGMVTVANSLALLYAERRRTFAALRLVGARPGQLLAAALIEAGMLALVASLVGAPLGLALGRLIEAALGALNTSVPLAGSVVSWRALGWSVLIGTVATVVAAVLPAARACRVPPIEAVSDADVQPTVPLRRSLLLVGAVATVVALGGGLLVLGNGGGTRAVTVGAAVGGAVAFIGLLPVILSGLVATGVRSVPLRPRALRRIAARDVVRNRTRTAATAAALILATAVVAGLAVFLASFTASIDGEVRRLVTADLVVDSGTFTKGGLPADLLDQVSGLDGVEATSGWEVGRATVGLTPLRLSGLDLGVLYDVLSPVWVGAPPSSFDTSSVLLSTATAGRLGVRVGDPLPVTFTSGGTEALKVAGLYDSGALLLGDAVIDRAVLKRQIPATTDIAALVKLRSNDAASRAAVTDLAKSYGVTSVLRPDQFVDRRADVLRGFQRVIEWMLLFSLVQALLGVVNTLLLSVGERRREFGLLRASGASRRQVLRLVLFEGMSLAVVGTAVGLVLGIGGARLAIAALSSLGVASFVVPPGSVLLTGLAAVTLGVAAAVAPARWASAVPPLEAVSDVGGLRSRPRRAQRTRLRRRGRAAFHWDRPAADPVGPAVEVTGAVLPVVVPSQEAGRADAPRIPAPLSGRGEAVTVAPNAARMDAPVTAPAPIVAVSPTALASRGRYEGSDDQFAPVSHPPRTVSPPPGAHADPWPEPPVASVGPPDAIRAAESAVPGWAESPGRAEWPEPLESLESSTPPVWFGPTGDTEQVTPVEAGASMPSAQEVDAVAPAPESARDDDTEGLPTAPADRRRSRVGRFTAGTTRRRRTRSEAKSAGAADGWITQDPDVPAPVFGPRVRADEPVAFRPGPIGASPAGPRFGATGETRGVGGAPAGPGGGAPAGPGGGAPAGPGGSGPVEERGRGDEDSLVRAVGRLDRASVEEGAPALAVLGGVLAPGEQVERVVQGRAKGLVCVVARTERRVIVVADRPSRPLVESLHPTRTIVTVLAGDDGRVGLSVSDGTRVLRLVGIRDVVEAASLSAPGRPDPGYF